MVVVVTVVIVDAVVVVPLAGSVPALSLVLITMNAETARATTRALGGDLIGKMWSQRHY